MHLSRLAPQPKSFQPGTVKDLKAKQNWLGLAKETNFLHEPLWGPFESKHNQTRVLQGTTPKNQQTTTAATANNKHNKKVTRILRNNKKKNHQNKRIKEQSKRKAKEKTNKQRKAKEKTLRNKTQKIKTNRKQKRRYFACAVSLRRWRPEKLHRHVRDA